MSGSTIIPSARRVHTVIVDWDGTAVPAVWPARPDNFREGFVEAMWRFHRAEVKLVICSARLTPFDPWTGAERDPSYTAGEAAWMRHMLDEAGLTFVSVWTKHGKPGGSAYIDDKGERIGQTKRSWKVVTDRVLMRLGKLEPEFPAFPEETD